MALNKQDRKSDVVEVGKENYKGNVERTMAVNDMYIDAIQAKLKLLDALWAENWRFIDRGKSKHKHHNF